MTDKNQKNVVGQVLSPEQIDAQHNNINLPEESASKLKEFLKDFIHISGKALPMAASYTFSIEQLAAGILSLHLSSDHDHAAATVLFQTVMATSIRVSLAPLFAVSLHSNSFFGQLNKAQQIGDVLSFDSARMEIANTFKAGAVKSVIVSLPAFFALFFSKEILSAFGQEPRVSEIASSFLKPFSASAPALAIRMCMGQMMYSNGDAKPAMIIGIGTFAIGTLLAAWFSNGGFGMEPMGLPGVAWGYNIESYLTAIAYAIYLFTGEKYKSIPFLKMSSSSLSEILDKLKKLISIAGPVTVTMLVETALSFSLGIFAGLLGVEEQAALSYAMQIVFLMCITSMAFGQATGHAVGRSIGADDFFVASRIARNGLYTTLISVIPPCLTVSIAPQLLYGILNVKDEGTKKLVQHLVPVVSAGAISQALRYSTNQVLRVLSDHKGSTLVSICGMLTGIAFSAACGLETDAALYAIAGGLAVGEGVSFAGLLWRWCARIKPERIEEVKKDPTKAEPQSWGQYFGSFFKCGKKQNRNVTEESYLLSAATAQP